MTLNVSNHNGALLDDHFLDPQSMPRVFYSKHQLLIVVWFEWAYLNNSLPGVGMVTHIPAGIRNRCIGLICCNLMD